MFFFYNLKKIIYTAILNIILIKLDNNHFKMKYNNTPVLVVCSKRTVYIKVHKECKLFK